MAHLFFILLASFAAVSAIRSFGRYNGCPQALPATYRGAAIEDGDTCGISEVAPILASPGVANGLGRGGYPAKQHSWPWVVSIQNRDYLIGREWKHMCVGTLISKRIVKTEYHCQFEPALLGYTNPFNWLVSLGPHNSSVLANLNTSVTIESWSGDTITLSNDVPENPFIKSICYGKPTFPIGYADCYTAGWTNEETWLHAGIMVGTANLSQAQVMLVSLDEFRRATGHVPNADQTAAVALSAGGFPSWRSLGLPLMCRDWCNERSGRWSLLGHGVFHVFKSLNTTDIYALFSPVS